MGATVHITPGSGRKTASRPVHDILSAADENPCYICDNGRNASRHSGRSAPGEALQMSPSLFDAYVPPECGYAGTWIGRVWVPGALAGPCVALVRSDGVYDISRHAAT